MLSFSPLDVMGKIWDVIESVSEEFLTYSFNSARMSFVEHTCHYTSKLRNKVLEETHVGHIGIV